jgi:hypothetical protein
MLARKEEKGSSASPGPGAYSPDGKLRKQIPISLKSRHFVAAASAGQPGPGAYTPSNPNHVSTQWTMLARRSEKGISNTPGPLDYRPEKPNNARVSSIHTKIKYKDSESLKNPGPGAYNETNTSKVRTKPPAYTIQGRTSYAPMSARTPGPGAYETPEARMKIAYSLTPRRSFQATAANPGPGAYSPNSGYSPRAAGMGVGKRFDDKDGNGMNPGPAAYNPSVDFYSRKESAPRDSMTARRDELRSVGSNPGPGAYTPAMESVKINSPRYTLGGRLDGTGKGVPSPGPAHYNPQRPVTAPGISLKGRVEFKPAFVTPGPSAYKVLYSCNACASLCCRQQLTHALCVVLASLAGLSSALCAWFVHMYAASDAPCSTHTASLTTLRCLLCRRTLSTRQSRPVLPGTHLDHATVTSPPVP